MGEDGVAESWVGDSLVPGGKFLVPKIIPFLEVGGRVRREVADKTAGGTGWGNWGCHDFLRWVGTALERGLGTRIFI